MRFSLTAFTACCAIAGTAAPANAAIITNLSATDPLGNTLLLAAGTYDVSFIGVADGGTYNGYSPFGSNAGCDSNGANCSQGWIDAVVIDFGHGTGNFDRNGSYLYIDKTTAVSQFDTALHALANVQTSPLSKVLVANQGDIMEYQPTPYPIEFTLAAAQTVNFFVYDSFYADNRGGVSLSIASPAAGAVPEPAAWAMMLIGFGGIGGAARARRGSFRSA
jgi:hypothetical protein